MIREMLGRHLQAAPDRIVVRTLGGRSHGLFELRTDVERLAGRLVSTFERCDGLILGIAMRSSYPWVVAMLAVAQVRAVLLPVPLEFSDEQIASLLGKASAVFVGDPETADRLRGVLPRQPQIDLSQADWHTAPWPVGHAVERMAPGLYGIIHTSGTTSRPKGVKIRSEAIGILVRHLRDRVPAGPLHYLSLVPMSLLIEQVLGVWLPLLSGGSLTLMPAHMSEFGARSVDAASYLHLLGQAHPNFAYLPPQLVTELDRCLHTQPVETLLGRERPHLITGGAKVPLSVLDTLADRGVTVYEAYGLSENSSVVSMNHPGAHRIGSAGPLLEGVEPRFLDGELLVKTPTLCAGYYNADDTACDMTDGYLHTGDLAEMRDGFLYITGRKKHVIILATARNISPEWVEAVYKESPLVDDIVVLGEGREEPAAVVLSPHAAADVQRDMARLAPRLAEFARVRRVVVVPDIDAFRRRYYTVTGRPRRRQIEDHYMAALYA